MMRLITVLLLSVVATAAFAVDVKLDSVRDSVETFHQGQVVKVERIQSGSHSITGSFAKTSRKCPPFCIQPSIVAPGVESVTEIDIFDFMETKLVKGDGVLIDARVASWHRKGTIPGSINIPFNVFEKSPTDAALVDALYKLGVRRRGEVGGMSRAIEKMGLLNGDRKNDDWDFTQAKEAILWCNGPWCGQSPRAIRGLLELGYPADKVKYYRGGMQLWQILGLTTIEP